MPPDPTSLAQKVIAMIADNATAAKTVAKHGDYLFTDPDTNTKKPLIEFFGDPIKLLKAVRNDGWIKPRDAAGSKFYDVFATGPMSWMPTTVVRDIEAWINAGAVLPGEVDTRQLAELTSKVVFDRLPSAAMMMEGAGEEEIRPTPAEPTPAEITPPTYGVTVPVSPIDAQRQLTARKDFAYRRQIIGMGSVH